MVKSYIFLVMALYVDAPRRTVGNECLLVGAVHQHRAHLSHQAVQDVNKVFYRKNNFKNYCIKNFKTVKYHNNNRKQFFIINN